MAIEERRINRSGVQRDRTGGMCVLDANTTITLADPLSGGLDTQAETGSRPLVAGSSARHQVGRDSG